MCPNPLLLAAIIAITCGWLRITIETTVPKEIPAWQRNHSETMQRLDRRREKARKEASEPYPPGYDYSGVIAG